MKRPMAPRWSRRCRRATLAAVAALTVLVPAAVIALPSAGGGAPAAADSSGSVGHPSPGPLPGQAPGDVLLAEPMPFGLDGTVRAWRVLYRSTSATGAPIAVSGSVLVPLVPWPQGPRPIVAHAIGTHGMGDQCAPSHRMAEGTDPEAGLVENLLHHGWAVAVTDYPGLGTPGDHHYGVGRALGQSVLDSLRAATRLQAAGLDPQAPMAVSGYSEGGSAAAWAAQLHPTYAPELPLRAVAAGGVPADLRKVEENLDGGYYVAFALAGGIGFKAAYPELPFEEYLNDLGKRTAADIADDCHEMLPKTAYHHLSDYTTTRISDLPAWRARIAENDLGGLAPRVPVFLYHATADQLIPYEVGHRLLLDWCAKGATVTWRSYPLGEHVAVAGEAAHDVADWIHARFDGLPAAGSC